MNINYYDKYKKYKRKYLNKLYDLTKNPNYKLNLNENSNILNDSTIMQNIKKMFGGVNKKYYNDNDIVYLSDSEDEDILSDPLPNEILDNAEDLENIMVRQNESTHNPKNIIYSNNKDNINKIDVIQLTEDETENKSNVYDDDLRTFEENMEFLSRLN